MPREKILPFAKARRELSKILDQVSGGGQPVIIAKRQRPVAAIIGLDKYREMAGARKYLKEMKGKRILKVRGLASMVGDVEEAIRALRKSRREAVGRSF